MHAEAIDTFTGARLPLAAPASDCSFVSVGSGQAMWSCGSLPNRYVHVLDLATGAARDVELPTNPLFEPMAVGRQWIYGRRDDPHFDPAYYMNWHTGAIDGASNPDSRLASSRVTLDLDRAGLARRLCKPLRRDRNASYSTDGDIRGEPFNAMPYEPPFAMTVPNMRSLDTIVLERCGSRRQKLFHGSNATLGGGLLSWSDGPIVRAYVLRTHRRYAWNAKAVEPAATGAFVVHTAQDVFFMPFANVATGRIYEAPWKP